jgi:hypothetical protein
MDPIGPLIAHLILTLLAHKRFLKALIKTVILFFLVIFYHGFFNHFYIKKNFRIVLYILKSSA